jgi:site-specific recombinase XerD
MRKYLKRSEIDQLMTNATVSGRYGSRDALMLRMMFTHGLRVSELCGLLWSDVDVCDATILIRRRKSGTDAVHPIPPEELIALTALYKQARGARHVFLNERGRPMQRQRVHEIVKRAATGLTVNVHCHTLRHSTGYALVKARLPIRNVQSFLGHAAISSTLVYAHLDETRFTGAVEALA